VNWKQSWQGRRVKFYFMLLWTAIVIVLSKMLFELDTTAWWSLYLYKGPGGWMFWTVHALLIAGMWLGVNFDPGKLRTCGFVLLMLGIFGAVLVYEKNGDSPEVLAAAEGRTYVPPPPSVPVELPRPTEELVPKGTVKTVPLSLFVSADRLPGVKVSVDGGPWKDFPEKLIVSKRAQTLQFCSNESDFYVTVLVAAN
jgi:hypothetical protein